MVKFLNEAERKTYRDRYSNNIVYNVLRASVSKFLYKTGGLRLSVEEIFINTYAAVDKARNDCGSDFFPAGVLLDEMLMELRNESVENSEIKRDCSDEDLNNAVVIIGVCAYFCLMTYPEFQDFASQLHEELENRNFSLFYEVAYSLSNVIGQKDCDSTFTATMRKYLVSEDYISYDKNVKTRDEISEQLKGNPTINDVRRLFYPLKDLFMEKEDFNIFTDRFKKWYNNESTSLINYIHIKDPKNAFLAACKVVRLKFSEDYSLTIGQWIPFLKQNIYDIKDRNDLRTKV